MSDSEGPPSLVDSSSNEGEGGCYDHRNRRPPSHNSNSTARRESATDRNIGAPPLPPPTDQSPPSRTVPTGIGLQGEAAEFCLSRMKQSVNLQEWDHNDFVRSLNESIAFPPSFRPLVVFQEAQVDAFLSGGSQTSPLNGWVWRGRKGSGVLKGIQGLGMLQHIRDSRLIPYRLGCNCLYEHPGLKHLFVGQQRSNAPSAFPRLMHINPSMRGPVYLRLKEDSVAPWGVAFAGAEFVVMSKIVIGAEEVWEVVSELFGVSLKPSGDDQSPTPGWEGLPEFHVRNGTSKKTLFIPTTLEGKPTLLEGQAPLDIDRFKAWHMSPQYHGISHHVWCLEDLRIFICLHRLALILWCLSCCVKHFTIFRGICAIIFCLVALQVVQISEASGRIYAYYRSTFGKIVMATIRVFLLFWVLARTVLKFASTMARGLLICLLALPGVVLPTPVCTIAVNVVGLFAELAQFLVGAVVVGYHGSIEAIVARPHPVPWLGWIIRFLDGSMRVLCNIFMFCFVALASLFFWWYCAEEESPWVRAQARYQELLNKTDAQSKMEFTKIVRELVFDLRAKNELAMDRRRRARANGALECSGERRGGDHACFAALAIAAVRLKRKVSSQEKAAITRILFKSGMIRDSLVRTARVMLATEPAKAIAEVAHELMHAAHAGLIWPDEPLIASALQSEGRSPTAENVMWHRSKWVAVAANMIVERESSCLRSSWFTMNSLPDAETRKEIDHRQCGIHPAERCVCCYAQPDAHRSSRCTNDGHMKTEGRRPSPKLSACRSAVFRDSRRRRLQPHCEMEDDDCRVILAASREVCGKPNEFPFFHAEARRQPKISTDRARRLAARLKSINDKYEELVRIDQGMAGADAPAPPPAPGPEQRPAPSTNSPESDKIAQDRKAAQERKARRLKARKEKLMEAEAIRKQRLQALDEAVVAAHERASATSDKEKEDGDDDEDDGTLCIVCMTEKRNACLVHGLTSHQVTCLDCANQLKVAKMGCPICKRKIEAVIENFTS